MQHYLRMSPSKLDIDLAYDLDLLEAFKILEG